ncbi:hypothetical protein [Azomonas macrocytogenes]|uniref:Transmembrane protein n=1 Tax=Azomonas macrocytogenes TaxID=69962 RepID=A0A839T7K1_AZOMA|nr:hypothetical protein [Azomonas macrocytogenes]MBB3104234.1 hypothetical protein [Azomonas macrocytogenes]
MTKPHEHDDRAPAARWHSLWLLTVGPTIWALHFLIAYCTAAVWCAKVVGRDGSLDGLRSIIGILTLVALAGIVLTGWFGYRQHSFGDDSSTHSEASSGDRHRFLGFSTLLLCGLSFVATAYVALSVVFIGTCQ